MIEIQKREESNFRNLQYKISTFQSKDEIYDFYNKFIDDYIELDRKYSFTVALDKEYVLNQISILNGQIDLPLYCVPIGVKDIFNTNILPTAMGSEIWKGFKSGNNARVIDDIIGSGGIIFSKTTTAEFAVHFITPESTINPYNSNHITGTSSSGSAVSVSCGALPITIGTQTAGSIIRPASFCGIYGFKPSFGAIDRTGVLKTNDTFDTIGYLSADIYGLKKIFFNTLKKGTDYPYSFNYFQMHKTFLNKNHSKLKIGIITEKLNVYSNFNNYVKKDYATTIDTLSKSYNITELPNLDFINEIHNLHEQMYSKSLSYYFKNEMKSHEFVSEVMKEMISRGEKITTDSYVDCLKKQPIFRRKFDKIFEQYDFIIVPSTASYAPEISQKEIDDTCLIWTFLGYPTITIPLYICKEKNLPYGLQVIAKKFEDFALLDFAEEIEKIFY
jgi:Asp-tRNA(Asn)/Glu-tRNA(Gln) amidotransferase A subunit family amidase